MQRRISPLTVMQNVAIIKAVRRGTHRRSIVDQWHCGLFSPLRYAGGADVRAVQWGCRACTYDARNGERLGRSWITCVGEGPNGMDSRAASGKRIEQMLRYRAGAFSLAASPPVASLGLPTMRKLSTPHCRSNRDRCAICWNSPPLRETAGLQRATRAHQRWGVAADHSSRIPHRRHPRERQRIPNRRGLLICRAHAPRAERRRSAVETGGTPAVEALSDVAAPVSAPVPRRNVRLEA